ncbi:response regulator transcription factor [Serratia plymuthica]|uniref:response regulator transcription factor n=1 Tax=Serratia plymuthica TaxID=82996 RepID=UPI0020C8F630|nr:response regulator [Serratia plymuthica]UTN94944.1 response regulator [Serratia plymuthica]
MEHVVDVVDDDHSVRQSIVRLLNSAGYSAVDFDCAEAFLSHSFPAIPGCIILDMRMPSGDGFEVTDALKASGREMPVIFLTGYGTIPLSVQAMKAGAHEFLTKPVASDDLLKAVQEALNLAAENSDQLREHYELKQRHLTLTPREQEVLELTIKGLMNKQIAAELGVSEITVKVHRRRVMDKMQVRSLADLVRDAERLNLSKSKAS